MGHRHSHLSVAFKTGILIKTGQQYDIALQSCADIDAMLALQAQVMADLSAEEKSYLVPKDRSFFEKHFANGNIVLGIKMNGMLIGQAIIVNPTNKNPKTGMTDMAWRISPKRVTVIQGVIVHPDFRGNRLMTEMVDAWLNMARIEGRRYAIAEVSAENHFSWSVFMKEGLKLHSIGYDAEDIVHLYNMQANVKQLIKARLKPTFNSAAANHSTKSVHVANADIERQKKLLRQGFKGVARHSQSGDIIFDKPKKNGITTLLKKLFP